MNSLDWGSTFGVTQQAAKMPATNFAQSMPTAQFTNPAGQNYASGDFTLGGGSQDLSSSMGGAPGVKGAWTDKASFGLGVAQVGLGAFNAYEQSKMNDFMRGYYGDQIALQTQDFSNNARSTNEALSSREERRLDARGIVAGSDESQAGVADYMNTWGVSETV
ncbi:MAG: hypothetical protein KAI17_09110 [Thiotrichaceae bacterium]|nr:hypothetical protein [Thiotrichaceae bacterium]